jgi:hypothetical protein
MPKLEMCKVLRQLTWLEYASLAAAAFGFGAAIWLLTQLATA